MKGLASLAAGLAALILAGCGNVAVNHVPHQPDPTQQKKLAVFFDGTANDEGSYTNVARLHNLVMLQGRPDVSTSYIKGVGVDGKVLGMATGWGIGLDVRQAYLYLAENYNHEQNDEIYIFGFSRGAYAARILAALIHVAGIPDLSGMTESERVEFIEKIYNAYKSDREKPISERRTLVSDVINKEPESVQIKFLGIWDTVEALGRPNREENVDVPNPRYADQLCNIDHAAHAVSLDDNRAKIFTPILLTRAHLIKKCNEAETDRQSTTDEQITAINKIVTEVWFSGAHADVGGGYNDTHLSGVSLNWMIGEIRKAEYKDPEDRTGNAPGLLPAGAAVYADFAGRSHDPDTVIYEEINRDIAGYVSNTEQDRSGKLKIHQSVVDRLSVCKVEPHESTWFDTGVFEACAKIDKDTITFRWDDHGCTEVVEIVDPNYRKNCAPPRCPDTGKEPLGEIAADKRPKEPKGNLSCRWTSSVSDNSVAARTASKRETAGK